MAGHKNNTEKSVAFLYAKEKNIKKKNPGKQPSPNSLQENLDMYVTKKSEKAI